MPGQDVQHAPTTAPPQAEQEAPSHETTGGPGNAATVADLQANGGLGDVPTVSRGGGTHTIAPGDTLWGIAESTYGSGRYWRDIMVANPTTVHASGDLIIVGDTLALPTLDVPDPSAAQAGAPAEAPEEAPAATPDAGMDGGACASEEPVGQSVAHGSYLIYPDAYTSPLPEAAGVIVIRQAEFDAIDAGYTTDGPTFVSVAGESGEDAGERARIDAFVADTHAVEGFALAGSGNFDLTYTPTTSAAAVEVRLAFEFKAGSVGSIIGALFNDDEIGDFLWSDEEKDKWREDFLREVHDHWSGQHALRCQEPDDGLVNLPRWTQLKADAEVNAVEDEANPHFTVEVERIPVGDFETSWVQTPDRDAAGDVTGPGHAKFDSNDMTPVHKASGSAGAQQTPAVHEFGHMLGLQDEYPSASRPSGTNTRQGSQVGNGNNDDRIMSGGDLIDQDHYESIKQALNAATSPVAFDFA
ncbi:MAG: LysM peptidoglycan-binding domain-containing protein [Alphaproteobacteria bacterium]|nr:LysM peptidoglycan-binding domain-containing protein [Alphaproteobacteria bacterium]